MPYSPTDLEAFVRQRAPEIAKEIQQAAERAHNMAAPTPSITALSSSTSRHIR
jgi:hypothetical protein